MGSLLAFPLTQLQRFIIPTLLILLVWAVWRTLFRKDCAIGLALYISLVVVVDGFYNTGIFLPGLPVGSIRYSEVCAAVLLLHVWGQGSHAPPLRKSVLVFVFFYFALMLLATLRADPLMSGVFDFRRIVIPQFLGLLLAVKVIRSTEEYRRFMLGMTALILLVACFCLWDVVLDRWILHSDMLGKPEYYHNRKIGRFGSLFLNPNYLGAFVVLIFPPVFLLTMAEPRGPVRRYLWAVQLALLFCLVETQSRGPIAAFAGSAAILALGPAAGVSKTRRIAGLAAGLLAFAVFMPGFIGHAMQRFNAVEYEQNEDAVSRATVWQYTRRLIAENPLAGIGFGEQQFLSAMAETDFTERYGASSLDNPHNSYLQAAVYAGIPAAAAFVLANLLLVGRPLLASWRFDPSIRVAAFGHAVGIVGFLVCIYPDMHLFTPNVAPVYWLSFGLLLSFTSSRIGVAPSSEPRAARSPEHTRTARAN